uniref:Tailless n=1 Tax=Leptinotarsa decemlineata TaxID=7539 RepID=A0A1S5UZQ4_LEPDE|nr:hypothetical protein [Leptinotarsa decemlineata]
MPTKIKIMFSFPGRILDIPCKVCGDFSSGKHYNIFACDGCAGFFKRSIRRNRQYVCKAKEEGSCIVDKTHRNQCRACRLTRCQEAGMNKDAVQHERGPRNSTLRRQQMSNFFSDARERMMVSPPCGGALDLAIPKPNLQRTSENPFALSHPGFWCNGYISLPKLPIPIPSINPPLVPHPSFVCEAAARLLFMNVQWTKSMPSLTSLPFADQLVLLEESWKELFILGAAQFLPITYLAQLIPDSGALERSERPESFMQNVQYFQELIISIRQFQADPHEYACLRAIVLFKTSFDKIGHSSSPSPTHVLSDPARISAVQDESQLTLNKYISTTHPEEPLRFGKMMLMIPNLRTVPGETIEELFFRKTIGNIPIVKIISDMYKTQFGL